MPVKAQPLLEKAMARFRVTKIIFSNWQLVNGAVLVLIPKGVTQVFANTLQPAGNSTAKHGHNQGLQPVKAIEPGGCGPGQ